MTSRPGNSFTAAVRNELARLPAGNGAERRAELAGLARTLGAIRLSREGIGLQLATTNAAIARKVFSLIRRHYGVSPEITVGRPGGPRLPILYRVTIRDEARVRHILADLSVDPALRIRAAGKGRETDGGVPRDLVASRAARIAFLRGLFLGAGHVHPPHRGYHLEMVTRDEPLARACRRLLSGLGLSARVAGRRDGYAVYIKEGDQVGRFLGLVGAHSSTLAFEDARVYREIRGQVNRLTNAETANLEKVVDAALRQVRDIRAIDREIGLERLPPALREAARLRLEHPDLSLAELGRCFRPPVSKSAVAHRIRRLHRLADSLRAREKESLHKPANT